jgi:hypothetical protein
VTREPAGRVIAQIAKATRREAPDRIPAQGGPAAGRDDAGGHGAAETERIADRDHPVADARITIREVDEREVVAFDLDRKKTPPACARDVRQSSRS